MKKSFLFLIALGLVGCDISPVTEYGEPCPGTNGEGILSYIGNPECTAENGQTCEFDGMVTDFSHYFKYNYCPSKYPKCIEKQTEDGNEYHCSLDSIVQIQCEKNTLPCGEGENTRCIDYSKDETCGAYDCNAINYGGKDCTQSNSRCKDDGNGNYDCRCGNNELSCTDQCVDPSSETTCGASDCNAENYGGDDCTQYDDGRRCTKGENNIYSCQCRSEDVLCNNTCIMPTNNDQFCGASGACNSTDRNSPDFMGVDCAAGGARCKNGQCDCSATSHWCTIEGNEHPECLDPSQNSTCNAIFNPETGICTVTACKENETCLRQSDNTYACVITTCGDSGLLCQEDGTPDCYPFDDIEHCGNCYTNCHKLAANTPYTATGCAQDPDNPASMLCTYECAEGMTNCGTPFAPNCVDTSSTLNHCGTCDNACTSSQYCEGGTCLNTDCQSNECTSKNDAGDQVCLNDDAHCGPDCKQCKNIHDNAYCLNGTCVITHCKANEHPIFDAATNQITACEKNSPTACAPTDRKISEDIVNCVATKGANVDAVTCTDAGYCAIVSCVAGAHLSSDGLSCIQNTLTACGSPTSSTTKDCTQIGNAETTVCHNDGTCSVSKCNTGYHLAADARTCVANSITACAPTNSSTTKNCDNIANSASTECQNGTCKVTACDANYHPNSAFTACVSNSNTACASTTSSSTVNCNTKISNSATTICEAGTCKVTACATNYHPNTAKTGCVQNTATACASTTSSTTVNCNTKIGNSATTKCDAGTCKVTACATNYHPNTSFTACVANSLTACASTTSATTTNCTSIANSVTRACTAGKCTVSKCAAGYHLNSGKTGCTANSNTSCAKVTSNSPVNCTTKSYEKVCNSSGVCACSKDGSTVLNYDKNACVIPACSGLPGVKAGTLRTKNFYNSSVSDYACQATACSSGYELYTNDGGSGAKNCKPKSGTCTAGYVNESSCNACCGHSKCKTGYRYYIMACYPQDVCCGTRGTGMDDATDYTCRNCAAQGKTCNISTGKCV